MKACHLLSSLVLCLQVGLVACLFYVGQVSTFKPPYPRKGQGFQLPLDITAPKQQWTNPGATKTFTKIMTSDTRELAYLVQISVGGQSFMFLLDTASADLWVASSNCMDLDCQAVQTYNKTSTLSLTQTPFELKYVVGAVSGSLGYERVILGQVEVHEQVLGIVTNVSNINLSTMRNSGILGFAFPKSSAIHRSAGKPFLENLYDGLDENNRFFAFQLGGWRRPSSFTIGRLDPSVQYNMTLSYFPVYPSNAYEAAYDYWKLPLHHISINDTPLTFPLSASRVKGSSSPIAVLDTGTSLILGPTRDVDTLWHRVGGATRDPQSGLWMIRCGRAISASFFFGGVDGIDTQEYFVQPGDLSWNGTQSGNLCLAGIQGNDKVVSGDWLLGDVFLRNVYATHHAATSTSPPLIGLANLIDPAAAKRAFDTGRGQDSSSQMNFVIKATPSFLLFSAVAGFACGLLVILVLNSSISRRILLRRKLFY